MTKLIAAIFAACLLGCGCNFLGRMACKIAGTTDLGAPAPPVNTTTNQFSEPSSR